MNLNQREDKSWEYFARFPFDVYNNYYKNSLIPKYAPEGFLIDHQISDNDQVVYVNEGLRTVVWTIRGTDPTNLQDLYHDFKILLQGSSALSKSKFFYKWLDINNKYFLDIKSDKIYEEKYT